MNKTRGPLSLSLPGLNCSAGSRLRGARGILLCAGPLRRGLATFATSTGAREPVRGKDKLSSQWLKEDGNFNRLIIFINY